MCGIAGVAWYSRFLSPGDVRWLEFCGGRMKHRGPDNQDIWFADNKKLALLHRRLSIRDLSSASNQPISSSDDKVTISFNGEIYNFVELRNELIKSGYAFTTAGDVEVLLNAYLCWGIGFVSKLVGMFAIAVYDERTANLYLIRDQRGEKPLYYTVDSDHLSFASELRCYTQFENSTMSLDEGAFAHYMSYGFSPGDQSLIKTVRKLPPGCYLTFNLVDRTYEISPFSIKEHLLLFNDKEKLEYFDFLFTEAIRKQLLADVSVGVLLSGGLDSSLVTAKASSLKSSLETFTVQFEGNESSAADVTNAEFLSRYFDTKHHQICISNITSSQIVDVARSFDEIIADSSILPTFLVYEEVSRYVKVVLGGDGSDEFFGGYRRYLNAQIIESTRNFLGYFGRHLLGTALNRLFEPGMRGYHFISSVTCPNLRDVQFVPTNFSKAQAIALLRVDIGDIDHGIMGRKEAVPDYADILGALQSRDIEAYLPDNILVKVDRLSMQHSLEARSPFLDPYVTEFAIRNLSNSEKVIKGQGKHFLWQYAKKILPSEFNKNVKNGFASPLNTWMRPGQHLRQIAEEVLYDRGSIFRQKEIEKLFARLDRGSMFASRITSILLFELWRIENRLTF
ncbi:asparagine synthase (glutamine-hydrolyzing) [Litorivicinus sp.]|nr:asparagine synthase (glutamine-hydrolyzing) [Litorivicinus sp.]